MLRNVLVDYLDNVRERDFDLPLLALLSAAGYYDIHFTHGHVEYGKDIIAKRNVEGVETQFSFQAKAGDITLSDWRNNVQGQMLESILIGLSHPNFSTNIPHQAVLVCTGRLAGNVSLALQELNTKIKEVFRMLPIIPWDQVGHDHVAVLAFHAVKVANCSGQPINVAALSNGLANTGCLPAVWERP